MKIALAILGAVAVIVLFFGAVRSWIRWEEDKEFHRRYGGSAPPKKEVRKLKP
jgi:hypothetical protein